MTQREEVLRLTFETACIRWSRDPERTADPGYLMLVGEVLMLALSHGTYNPMAWA